MKPRDAIHGQIVDARAQLAKVNHWNDRARPTDALVLLRRAEDSLRVARVLLELEEARAIDHPAGELEEPHAASRS